MLFRKIINKIIKTIILVYTLLKMRTIRFNNITIKKFENFSYLTNIE
jgi:hypothetical protein